MTTFVKKINSGLRQFARSRLGKKQLFYIILFSSIITLIGTTIQLIIDYRVEVQLVEKQILQFKSSHLKSLTSSLWKLDDEQIQIELDNATQVNDITYVEIREESEPLFYAGNKSGLITISQTFDMIHNDQGRETKIGTVEVVASLEAVYEKIYNRVFLILTTQAIKTFLVSLFILFIIYRLVIRHLLKFVNHLTKIDLQSPNQRFKLERTVPSTHKPDELDQLADAVNQMNQKLYKDFKAQKHAELKLEKSLNEKEILLKEIHHRVKNNMQVMTSLLNLQITKETDECVKQVLMESQGRVYAMSAVHEFLYGSENIIDIDIKSYLAKVAKTLLHSFQLNPVEVSLNISADEIRLHIEKANPLGLITNELITNALKYAFPGQQNGAITLKIVQKNHNIIEYTLEDNGVGFPDGFDWRNANSLGLQLVRTLVENQLQGSIQYEGDKGSKFVIEFTAD